MDAPGNDAHFATVISSDLYNKILPLLNSSKDLEPVAKNYNVCYNSLVSILAQKIQKNTRRIMPQIRKAGALEDYYQRYSRGAPMLALATESGLPACLFAREILKHHLVTRREALIASSTAFLRRNSSNQQGTNTTHNAAIQGSSTSAHTSNNRGYYYNTNSNDEVTTAMKNEVTSCIRDPQLILDPRLREEVRKCIVADDIYSPLSERIRTNIGQECEFLLHAKLTSLGVEFFSESDMRRRGESKTPDARLYVSIIVDGRLVSWIESKALFGDEETHATYLKDQLRTYRNRYGPGLVIYWMGYIQELNFERAEEGILVSDQFPNSIEVLRLQEKKTSANT